MTTTQRPSFASPDYSASSTSSCSCFLLQLLAPHSSRLSWRPASCQLKKRVVKSMQTYGRLRYFLLICFRQNQEPASFSFLLCLFRDMFHGDTFEGNRPFFRSLPFQNWNRRHNVVFSLWFAFWAHSCNVYTRCCGFICRKHYPCKGTTPQYTHR